MIGRFWQRHKRWLWRIAMAIGLFIGLGLCAWCIAPYCVEDPLPTLLKRSPATLYTDANGHLLYAHSGYDAQWRFDVPLERISPDAIRATLIAEDADFYKHAGVDYGALARAFWQNLTSGKIISGASTISMQVASLAIGRKRSIWSKFLQAARARKMERLHPKEEILAAYLNHAPYGGKITGIEAAARYYFNATARDLTFAEATLLCGLPQRPNAFRLDRHFEAARIRQQRLLKMMVRRNFLTEAQAKEIFETAGLRCRDYSRPADFQRVAKPDENLHALKAGYPIHTEWQKHTLMRLRQQQARLANVNDGACVILDRNAPEKPIVYIGTLHFDSPEAGQVDAARAQRSAGSVLKPFFYAAAIHGGLITADTQLLDAPLRYADYAPENYDGTYRGWVSARDALADSLNTPVIRLLNTLGEERVTALFQSLQLPLGKQPGLTFALGTGGVTLLQLVSAYHHLPDILSPDTETLVAHMLRRPLPHTELDVAWKTGTANNNTDAWCVGWTPDYVVGVWFGNKSGRRSEALVGVDAAAPIVGDLFNLLYAQRTPPFWNEPSAQQTLCKTTGLRASTQCTERINGFVHPTTPLQLCNCTLKPTVDTPLILSPLSATYRGNALSLPLVSSLPNTRWFLDGHPVEPPLLHLTPGAYTLRAISGTKVESCKLTVISPSRK